MTANCRRLVSVDHSATNGVIHIVSEVLPPVTSSLAEIITNTPQLSQFARSQYRYTVSIHVLVACSREITPDMGATIRGQGVRIPPPCLLYTSDAADE